MTEAVVTRETGTTEEMTEVVIEKDTTTMEVETVVTTTTRTESRHQVVPVDTCLCTMTICLMVKVTWAHRSHHSQACLLLEEVWISKALRLNL